MGKVAVGLSMSLEGFVAGPNDGPPDKPLGEGGERLFAWYFSGNIDFRMPGGGPAFKLSPASVELLRVMYPTVGALVTGRRTFDITNGWGGNPPLAVPAFVVTHAVPQEWVYGGSPFTFVTDGVESAIPQAKAAAGDKNVSVGAASAARQAIEAGLLDEIHIDLVSVLLGGGVHSFEHLGTGPIDLERTRVIEASSVTHLTFRVLGN